MKMTYEEYGVWLERHVADCSDGEGRAMLKMCLSHFKEIAPTPEAQKPTAGKPVEDGLRAEIQNIIDKIIPGCLSYYLRQDLERAISRHPAPVKPIEVQKPTADGTLIEELKIYCAVKFFKDTLTQDYNIGIAEGHDGATKDVESILSRYTPAPIKLEHPDLKKAKEDEMTNSGNHVADIGEQEYERRNECPACKREAWDEVKLCMHDSEDCEGVACPYWSECDCRTVTILRCKCGHEAEAR